LYGISALAPANLESQPFHGEVAYAASIVYVITAVTDLCDDDEMRNAVLSLLNEIQHKRLSDLHNVSVDRQSSSLKRYSLSLISNCFTALEH